LPLKPLAVVSTDVKSPIELTQPPLPISLLILTIIGDPWLVQITRALEPWVIVPLNRRRCRIYDDVLAASVLHDSCPQFVRVIMRITYDQHDMIVKLGKKVGEGSFVSSICNTEIVLTANRAGYSWQLFKKLLPTTPHASPLSKSRGCIRE
jgi:hypothetical protein